ncbi:MAG TPA: glycosyltransferase family 39 protein [Opitutus sp.]|nr:glycosyltransferase family 39 protein [Opitutus sp.]
MNLTSPVNFRAPSLARGAVATTNDRTEERSIRWLLPLTLAMGALVRLALAFHQPLAIEAEGAEYAYIARSLLEGRGYVGSLEGGVQLLFPPLFPLLIAGVASLGLDVETAGRLVAIVAGTLLIVPVYAIARRLYQGRVAVLAAAIVALHPVLVHLSISVYSEGPFVALLLTAALFSLRCLHFASLRDAGLAGLFLGLAYLTRTEAAFYPLLVAAIFLLAGYRLRVPPRRVALFAATVFGVFALVAAPYAVFLTVHTGSLRLEGKSALNLAMAERMNRGMSYVQASYGVSDDLREQGPILNVNTFIRTAPVENRSLGSLLHSLALSARRNAPVIYDRFLCLAYGGPLTLLLIAFGLFGRPWNAERTLQEMVLLGFCGLLVVVLLAMNGVLHRYTFAALPFFAIWSARGIDELAIWGLRTAAKNRLGAARLVWVPRTLRILIGTTLFALSAAGVGNISEFDSDRSSHLGAREAGRWLAGYRPGEKRVFDAEPTIAFYSRGTLLCLPWASSEVALRYIAGKSPDFIILKGRLIRSWPFMQAWIDGGIPDARARLVYARGQRPDEQLFIYEWRD